ncbi:MAG: 3-methyl-2-oxobutanoate hydroxymethyltransferase [Gammaproteobacteria bacterium]|nr:3-methyl-2-oxobutanoate hydroxymethyltransferase [Gammaproteobacteria bacterium]
MSSQAERGPVSINTLNTMKKKGEKFAALTAYDALFAELISTSGIEVILVGDSLGMVLQGHDSTLPVTLDDMVYHMNTVRRGNQGCLIMADLPFMSYASESQSLESAAALMRCGAHMVKLEGGAWLAESTRLLFERGIPVCAHMGLTPQAINRLGGYRVQGRNPDQASIMVEEALILQDSGASILLLECVPTKLGKQIAETLEIPVIGIGAGPHTDGQIMVMHDMLGITPTSIRVPKFVKNFMPESTDGGVKGAFEAYAQAVHEQRFPGPEHSFK